MEGGLNYILQNIRRLNKNYIGPRILKFLCILNILTHFDSLEAASPFIPSHWFCS